MSSSSAYNPFLKNVYSSSGTGTPSESEISSVGSDWSDLKSIAAQLGFSSADELVTERFKVDRGKLETMIRTDTDDVSNEAEDFFNNIMKETNTFIGWPCRLKLGARTRKDPHVRIVGKRDDVLNAKERVMLSLNLKTTRVIMKMDVSYTDHSYIIGRSGNNIRQIMEETVTHIHFPDSNRSNSTEKSNQVSLCGNVEGVEMARALVRASAPIVISFELPIMAHGHPVPDNETPFIKEIEEKYSVQVIFSTRPKLHSSLVLIKGSEKDVLNVKKATQLLIGLICENITCPTNVQMQLEISIQHHYVVAGKNSDNLRAIMNSTGTEIMFPDAGDINIKPIKRSQVTITGSIDGVYLARQQLIGNLPIVLIFDYPECSIDSEVITKLMNDLGVFINVRQKTRQTSLCIIIKGIEKFIDKIYDARHQLLNLNGQKIIPKIPQSYFSLQDGKNSVNTLLANPPNTTTPVTPPVIDFVNMVSKNNAQWNNSQDRLASLRNHLAQNINIPSPSSSTQNINNNNNNNNNSSNENSFNRFLHPNNNPQQRNININTSSNSSGYQSFSGSTNSLEQSFPNPMQMNSVVVSPDTTGNYYNNCMRNSNTDEGNGNANLTPTPQNSKLEPFINSFERKKIYGLKALEIPPQTGELRIPTPTWAGMSLSRTSPTTPTNFSDIQNWNRERTAQYNLGVTTSLIDAAPKIQRRNLAMYNDMHTLMVKLGLEHYMKTFVDNEIDYQVFQSLSDNDLQLLGISALGARRKLLLAIREINANLNRTPLMPGFNHPTFSGSAAPGAERRLSGKW